MSEGSRRRRASSARAGRPGLSDAVAAAARALFAGLGGGPAPGAFDAALTFRVLPGPRWQIEADPPLDEQLLRALRDAAARREALQPGRVWCYRCESARCEHAAPPAADRVFAGYGPTGLPSWVPLTELLLELRHPGVAALFEARSRSLAAAFIPGAALSGRQLEIFGRGSKTYEVLAQAVFGYLELRSPGGDAERAAFTLQAVETRSSHGAPRLDLNVIGRMADGSPALDALESPAQLRVLNIITVARRRLRHLLPGGAGGQHRAEPPQAAERAAAVLREAVRSLEHLGRQSQRRTLHAEGRGLERRPTGKAREDALAAPPECLLRDERRGTVIVLGASHRVHVFNPEGRHITSLLLDAEGVRRRRSRERWEPLPPGAARSFRAALSRASRDDATAGGSG